MMNRLRTVGSASAAERNITPLQEPQYAPTVLLIVPQPFFEIRGSSFRVHATVTALVELGYKVDVLVFGLGQPVEIDGVKIHRTRNVPGISSVPIGPSWKKFVLDVVLLFTAIRLLSVHRYSSLHGIEDGGVIAAFCGRWKRIPYIVDMHSCMSAQIRDRGGVGSYLLSKVVSLLEFVCAKNAAAVMTVGTARADFVASLGLATPTFVVEDCALEISASVDPVQVSMLKKELDLDCCKVILYTGNLAPYQGVDILIRSFAELTAQFARQPGHVPVKLVIVGNGEEEEAQKREYETLLLEKQIQDSVAFVGRRPPQQIGNFMALADVLVSPRASGDNTPHKVYSYLAAGKAIVATRIISHTQVLDDRCAYLCEPEVGSFARSLAAALDESPEAITRRASRIECAKNYSRQKYSRRSFVEKIKRLYDAVSALPPQ